MPEQWTCDECGDVFQRREHHQRHLRTHTKEKPFACSVCGSSFGRIDSLARHHSSTHMNATNQAASSESGERQRVSRACKRCSTAKVKCNGKHPCEKCSIAEAECIYGPPKRRRNSQHPGTERPPKRQSSELSAHQEILSVPLSAPSTGTNEDPPFFIDPIDPQICGALPLITMETPDLTHLDFFDAPRLYGLSNDMTSMNGYIDGLDLGAWPAPYDLQTETQLMQNICRTEFAPPPKYQEPAHVPLSAPYMPPTPASDIAELFSRSHSPVLDKDAVHIRQYHPTSIEHDAPLSFPDMGSGSVMQADMEDFAHVEGLSTEKLDAVTLLLDDMQNKPHYPPFNNSKLPPQSVLNAWIQLYFEYFHPIFPVLHKATFASPETPPLLVLAVAAIGAQFSNLQNAFACACSLHELVRRLSSRQCEFQNKHGRTVWMTQVVMLNSLAMSHSGERRALEVSEILQAVPVALARRKGLLDDILPHQRIAELRVPLKQTWQLWAMDEERRRTGFGVWLVDSAFRSDFNLTTVLSASELKNSLPQSEQRWTANSAQSWVSYPPGLGSGRTMTLADVVASDNWLATWSKTGTIGKQVILQHLMDKVRPSMPHSSTSVTFSTESAHAKDVLESLLSMLEEDVDNEVNDLKALVAHKAICLAALMIHSSPAIDLTTIALGRIYNRLNDRELAGIAEVWKQAPHQGREVVAHAARLFETIRTNHTVHFSMPAYLLRAILTLWLYSLLFEPQEATDSSGSSMEQEIPTSIALGTVDVESAQVRDWITHGYGRIKLPSIANLLCKHGRLKLLEHSKTAMRSLKSWGISKGHLQLLKRLEASETAYVQHGS
ncbi:hypothetical protein ACN47E_008721 [Coniothyrium glycines]